MVKLILLSSEVIWDPIENAPRPGVVEGLQQVRQSGVTIFFVSMHQPPSWLAEHFDFIKFCRCPPRDRKSGKVIDELLRMNEHLGLKKSDILIFGAKDADFQMAVNSQTLLVSCGWVPNLEEGIKNYGIGLRDAHNIGRLIALLKSKQPWYFRAQSNDLNVYSLTNAGTIGVTDQSWRAYSK